MVKVIGGSPGVFFHCSNRSVSLVSVCGGGGGEQNGSGCLLSIVISMIGSKSVVPTGMICIHGHGGHGRCLYLVSASMGLSRGRVVQVCKGH